MIFRKCGEKDIDEIEELYDRISEYLAEHVNYPGWIKGVYPSRPDAEEGVRESTLYAALDEQDGRIAGTFMLRHRQESGYALADWKIDLPDEKVNGHAC